MPTLLLSPRQSEDAQRLWRAAIARGWKTERGRGSRLPEIHPAEVVLYGEPWFVHHAAEHYGLTLHEPPLDWLPRLPLIFRGREVQAMTLAEARTTTYRAFIKPTDQKAFPAAVYDSGAALPMLASEFDAHPVLVQEVVRWVSEFRCFVLNGRVQTVSIYLRDGKLAQAEDGSFPATDEELREAADVCEAAAAAHAALTSAAVVIDVGQIDGRGWAVVEANEPHSSGIRLRSRRGPRSASRWVRHRKRRTLILSTALPPSCVRVKSRDMTPSVLPLNYSRKRGG